MNNKSILITGGTGSFGTEFVKTLVKNFKPKKLIIFSRDEMKQWSMSKKYMSNKNIRFFLGDIRDKDRLIRALNGIDYVVHAAAQKIVPSAEYNPFECVKTNVIGAMNLIDACIDQKVKKVVALSTDKASSPINLYGATKLASDKLFIAGNTYSGKKGTLFSVVRYGNVMGSRGSVIPLFLSLNKNEKYPITDKKMTRFMITLEQGIKMVLHAFTDMKGGEIYIKKIPSINVTDIALSINKYAKFKEIGVRPGEKMHEQMISQDDAPFTYEYKEYFKILPSLNDWHLDKKRIGKGKIVDKNFEYSSKTNQEWMKKSDLKKWINKYFN